MADRISKADLIRFATELKGLKLGELVQHVVSKRKGRITAFRLSPNRPGAVELQTDCDLSDIWWNIELVVKLEEPRSPIDQLRDYLVAEIARTEEDGSYPGYVAEYVLGVRTAYESCLEKLEKMDSMVQIGWKPVADSRPQYDPTTLEEMESVADVIRKQRAAAQRKP